VNAAIALLRTSRALEFDPDFKPPDSDNFGLLQNRELMPCLHLLSLGAVAEYLIRHASRGERHRRVEEYLEYSFVVWKYSCGTPVVYAFGRLAPW
jgi:hypothetical protein